MQKLVMEIASDQISLKTSPRGHEKGSQPGERAQALPQLLLLFLSPSCGTKVHCAYACPDSPLCLTECAYDHNKHLKVMINPAARGNDKKYMRENVCYGWMVLPE